MVFCITTQKNARNGLMLNPGNLCWSHRTSVEVSNEEDIFQNYWKTKRNSDGTTFDSSPPLKQILFHHSSLATANSQPAAIKTWQLNCVSNHLPVHDSVNVFEISHYILHWPSRNWILWLSDSLWDRSPISYLLASLLAIVLMAWWIFHLKTGKKW